MFTSRHKWFGIVLVLALAAGTAYAKELPSWHKAVNAAGGFWKGDLKAEGWGKVLASNPEQELKKLPKGVQTMLETEVKDNPWTKGHEEMKKKLGKFRPEARQVFDLPYIPIPASQMKFGYEDAKMSANMKANATYTKGGKKMIRFFIHPLYADRYENLINKYGIKYGEYNAVSTSSPRSLVVWQKNKPTKPIWVKVSLHAHLDYYYKKDKGVKKKVGISRVQSEKKARRSALVNEAFGSFSPSDLSKHKLEYMAEPASYVPGDIQVDGKRVGFDRSTIFREIPKALTNTNSATEYIPAFTFIKRMKGSLAKINADRQRQGKKPVNVKAWMTKGLMEPLVRTYIHMGLEHGLQGELHTQNFLLEVNKKTGVPTGKLMIKDLDGFRMDLDMRIRNNRTIKYLDAYKHPFEWAKHGATQGYSDQAPAVLQAWFNKLIRNVNGFTTTRTVDGVTKKVYATPAGQLMVQLKKDFPNVWKQLEKRAVKRDPSLRGDAEKTQNKAIEQIFDAVGKAQFSRIAGIRVPKDKWGFGQKKGLNYGLFKLREKMFRKDKGLGASIGEDGKVVPDKKAEAVLASTFQRIRQNRKADNSLWFQGNPQHFRLLGDKVIEGITKTGKRSGYAILKPADVTRLKNDLRAKGLRPMSQRTRVKSRLGAYSAKNYSQRVPFPQLRGR